MIESKIDELLAKLEELDPVAYGNWCDEWYDMEDFDYSGEVALRTFPKRYLSVLQGVIQDAIMSKTPGASHQWIYHARGRVATSGPDYRALVGVLEVVDCAVVDRTHEASGDTPAEALLAAYVAALEAEAAR